MNFTFEFEFERKFDFAYHTQWLRNNMILPLLATLTYLAVIFFLKAYMSNKTKLELRKPLILWNVWLAVFSIIGALRVVPLLLVDFSKYGFHHTVCDPSFYIGQTPSLFWMWLFTLSKLAEFGDTLFVVLRKQELIFLHWYHHATVPFGTWIAFGNFSGLMVWATAMNFSVHAIMYSYYALRISRIKMPRWISMFITVFQIVQMLGGLNCAVFLYIAKMNGWPCDVPSPVAAYFVIIYTSYLFLFSRFFFNSYIRPATSKKQE